MENLTLVPEVSHNGNLGLVLDELATSAGTFRAAINGFLRKADRLIVLLGTDQVQRYQNVYAARSLGIETALGWTAPGDSVVLGGNATYQDFRNGSSQGTFGKFVGDRIPNRPYLFANAFARVQLRGVAVARDAIAFRLDTHYVHAFYRAWESVGRLDTKQVIPDQLVHSAGVSYRVEGDPLTLTWTLEAQNVTDAPVFDFFGVQRPGRAFHAKTTLAF